MSIPSADHELHRGHTLAGPLSCKTLFIVNSELWTWSNQTGSRYHAQDDLMFLSALYLTCRWGNLQLWPESHMKAKSFLSEHIPGNLKGTLNLQQCNPEATHCTNNKCFLKDNLHWSGFLHFKHMKYVEFLPESMLRWKRKLSHIQLYLQPALFSTQITKTNSAAANYTFITNTIM